VSVKTKWAFGAPKGCIGVSILWIWIESTVSAKRSLAAVRGARSIEVLSKPPSHHHVIYLNCHGLPPKPQVALRFSAVERRKVTLHKRLPCRQRGQAQGPLSRCARPFQMPMSLAMV
jgi:hypothetical protein